MLRRAAASMGRPGSVGAGAARLAPPALRDGRFVFELGETYFEVEPRVGARVVAFRQAGVELLSGPSVHPDNYGSTFWPSPQSDWEWPPIAAVDSEPYEGGVSGDALVLQSEIGRRGELAVRVLKRFTADVEREAIVVEYTIQNEGERPRRVAPWEITRVPTGGLTFYPGAGAPRGENPPVTIEAAGHTWFPYDAGKVVGDQKLFADGGGWIAHVAGDRVLIKAFPEMAPELAAPGEAQIEIYANAARTYVEVEQQGPYVELAPGERTTWPVTWYARRLPAGVAAGVGSAELVAFVTDTLR